MLNQSSEKSISTRQLVDKISLEFHLKNTPDNRNNIRKSIKRYCQKIDLIQLCAPAPLNENLCYKRDLKAIEKKAITTLDLWYATRPFSASPNADHRFKQQQIDILLSHEPFLDFLKNCESDNPKLTKKLIATHQKRLEEVKEQNEKITEYSIEDVIHSDDIAIDITSKKLEIMIEALFLHYFTPIDEELLRHDMELTAFAAEQGFCDEETLTAQKRLFHPHEPNPKNPNTFTYYSKR